MKEQININPSETLEAGTYAIIRKRLQAQKDELAARLHALNEARKELFSPSCRICNPAVAIISICNAGEKATRITNPYNRYIRIANPNGRDQLALTKSINL